MEQTGHETFQTFKKFMYSLSVLAPSNFLQPFVIETNASGNSIGVVFMQQGHPIVYINKSLSPKHQALSVYEQELLAIVPTVTTWHHYLMVDTLA